jgi:anti-sigma B factor antagonist
MPEHAATKTLRLVVEQKHGTALVRCSGRLVYGVGDQLYNQIRDLTSTSRRIVLDFTELAHMDSSGIGTLVRAYVHSKSAGCTLELVNIGKPIRQLLGVTHLLEVFETIGRNQIRMG